MDDVILNKYAIIDRCLKRVEEEYRGNGRTLSTDFTRQDSIILNIQRACQTAQDLANRVIRIRQLGIPQNARESFSLLADTQLLPPKLANTLSKMVGFRNIAVLDILPPLKHPKGIKSGIPVSHLTGFLFHRSLLREQAGPPRLGFRAKVPRWELLRWRINGGA